LSNTESLDAEFSCFLAISSTTTYRIINKEHKQNDHKSSKSKTLPPLVSGGKKTISKAKLLSM
jgi:hypothetical protein